MDKQPAGTVGGTYAGNAVACAAAGAVVDVMKEENILENVNARSSELFAALDALRAKKAIAPYILDARGEGLMVGVEFASPTGQSRDQSLVPNAPKTLASRISKKCQENGMLLLTTSVFEVVRFIPPLNVSKAEMKEGMDIFTQSVEEVVKEG